MNNVANPGDLIDKLKLNPFLDGPTQALCKSFAQVIASVKQFRGIFGDNIDTYERLDYSMRQLPALRIYNHEYTKEQESHYITGTLLIDIVFPADIRRAETQYFQDVLSAAVMQQLRRPHDFEIMKKLVPGLNELGKVFSVDKSLGMKWDDGVLPITEMRANFRIDLKVWDAYLEDTGRTKDDPFTVTLEQLRVFCSEIIPTRDDGSYDQGAAVKLAEKTGGA